MANSGTASDPPDWVQFIQQNLSGQALNNQATFDNQETTNALTGTISTSASAISTYSQVDDPSPSSGNLILQGRVSKPSRRRSRASRRTPTTLVNTDASNFRAMVQQFTGGPVAPPYAGVPQYTTGSNINFGFSVNQQSLNPAGVHVQQQQQRQVHQQAPLQQQYMFNSVDRNHDGAFLGRSYDS